ncbi:MAG TPA: hypothetical protein VM598_07185 [Bdellovibrionota bacterium]|nr:hypothetical protein [Bdellovibrionota bacterium]
MKLALASVLLFSSAAFAEGPYIIKSSHSGFTPPEYVRHETCEVLSDRVRITRHLGSGEAGVETVEEKKLAISPTIANVIARAQAEPVVERANGLCDGPSTTIATSLRGPEHVLFTTGGCGSSRKERNGPYSKILRELVDQYCAKTYDFRD